MHVYPKTTEYFVFLFPCLLQVTAEPQVSEQYCFDLK